MKCALCGQPFDETALSCRGKCPVASLYGCGLLCCPHCGYQMVDERQSGAVKLLRRLWPLRVEETQDEDGYDNI